MNYYKVWMRTKPGPITQYDGFLEVYASGEQDAIMRAGKKFRQIYGHGYYVIEKIEVVCDK